MKFGEALLSVASRYAVDYKASPPNTIFSHTGRVLISKLLFLSATTATPIYRATSYLSSPMKYYSINLYRKMLNCAMAEGMDREDFMNLPTPINTIDDLQAIPGQFRTACL